MPDPIKVMQNEMACVNRQITGCDRACQRCDLRLEDIEIIRAYEAAIEALEKQKPQKVVYTTTVNEYTGDSCLFYNCPYCHSAIAFRGIKHCDNCGQALDWRVVE